MRAEKREKAKVAVVNPNGEILVLKRSTVSSHRPDEWDWPGGKLDKGESPYDAAIRETHEEAGLALDALIKLVTAHPDTHLFAALERNPPYPIQTSHEHSRGMWLPLADFLELQIPAKYIEAVQNNLPVFGRLIEKARTELISVT